MLIYDYSDDDMIITANSFFHLRYLFLDYILILFLPLVTCSDSLLVIVFSSIISDYLLSYPCFSLPSASFKSKR